MSTTQGKILTGAAVLSSALLLGVLGGCKPQQNAADLMADARQLQQKGDNVGALIQLKNAVARAPADGEARLALAQAYNRLGDAVSAEKEVRKAMELGLAPARTLHELLLAQLLQAQFDKVVAATDAIAYTAGADVISQRGVAFYQLARHPEAVEAFERALKLEPGQPVALMGLANMALARKDAAAAKGYVDLVVERNPTNPDVWAFKGDYERSLGNNAGALAAYQQVLKADPGSAVGHLQSAYVLIAERRYDEAGAALAAARKIAPKNLNVTYMTALVAFTQKQYPQALEALQQVLKVAPDHWPSVLLAGATQFSLKSLPQAEQHLKRYVDTFPDSDYARKLLASTRIGLGDPKGAIGALQPLLESTEDPQLLAVAGKAFMDNHEYPKATAAFEKASTLQPKAAPLRTSLGLAKLQEGDQARAMTELELATSLDLGSTDAGTTLALTAIRLRQYDKALSALAKLEQQRPKDAGLRHLSGLALLGKQDRAAARARFEQALALQPDFFGAVDSLARMDLEDKQADNARRRYEAFLQTYPKNVAALTALGALSMAQGQPALATTLLERANAVDPNAVEPAIFLATHYRRIGDKVKALTLIRKLQVANPQDPAVLDQLGQLQFANGDSSAAMETFTRLTVVAPQSAQAHFRLATAHDAMNNLPSASSAYKRALSLQNDNLDIQLGLAAVLLRQGLPNEALSLARSMQKQHPGLPVGWVAEGDILMLQNKVAQAAPLYDKAFGLGKNAELLIKLYDALRLSGRAKEGEARVAAWRASHADDVKVAGYIGSQHLANKNYQLAITEFEAILKKQPAQVSAMNNLALAYAALKDPRALPTAEAALKAAPDSADVLDTVGEMLVEQGDAQRGVALLQKAVLKSPDRPDLRYHLIRALIKTKDKDGARKEFDVLAARHANFPLLDATRELLK